MQTFFAKLYTHIYRGIIKNSRSPIPRLIFQNCLSYTTKERKASHSYFKSPNNTRRAAKKISLAREYSLRRAIQIPQKNPFTFLSLSFSFSRARRKTVTTHSSIIEPERRPSSVRVAAKRRLREKRRSSSRRARASERPEGRSSAGANSVASKKEEE